MKNFLLTIAFMTILICNTSAQVQSLVNFNNTLDLTTLFNPDATPVFTNIADQGIGNTGSINVPLGSNDIWTTKSGYSVSGEGDVYTLSAFFKIKENSGYGGLGFSSNDTNEPDSYGSPVYGLGMAFHGGGGMFINNRVQTSVSWPPDLVIGNWYKMILKVTAKGSNLFDMIFQIWNCDANGTIGIMKTEKVLNDVSNTQVGSATTLHVYFSAAGSRMEKIDDFEINLEGGAVIIEEGEPVLTTDAVTSITATTATCGGNVTDDRGSAVTIRGVCWSTTTNPTTALSTKTSDGTGTGVFTSSLTDLQPSTTYYVRAYATNGVGTSYGAEVSFTTSFGAVLPVGSGTIGDPYQIATLANLYWITQNSTEWSKYYIQTSDIDASSTSTWDSGAGWSPIGNSTIRFSGTYDGDGHTISGLYINRSSSDYQSFIGFTNTNTVIKNLGLLNVNFTGHWHVGGLVACPAFSTISKCFTTGSVSGSDNFVGGLFGYSHITNADNCYTTASVTGTGIADYIGGAIGYLNGGTLVKSYSTGVVTGTSSHVGGLVSYGSGTVTGSFWDTQSSGKATSFLGTGKTTAEMKTNSTFLSAGWDETIWNIGDGINDGYPYLDWQNPTGTPLPVELSSFSASIVGSAVKLIWSTATEINNYGFEVERYALSAERQAWNKIGFVNGNGNSNSPKDYSFVDDKVSVGKYSYRLKQVDNDGQFEYSKSIEIDFNVVKKYELTQNYPNPFNPATSIQYAISSKQFVTLKVYNLLGREVATLVNENKEAGNYMVNFDASILPSGVYIYKLQAGDFVQTKKMTLVK